MDQFALELARARARSSMESSGMCFGCGGQSGLVTSFKMPLEMPPTGRHAGATIREASAR